MGTVTEGGRAGGSAGGSCPPHRGAGGSSWAASWLDAEHVRLPGGRGLWAGRRPQRGGPAGLGRRVSVGNTGQGVGGAHPPGLEGGVSVVVDRRSAAGPIPGPTQDAGWLGTQGVQASSSGSCRRPQSFKPRPSSVLCLVRPPSSRCGRTPGAGGNRKTTETRGGHAWLPRPQKEKPATLFSTAPGCPPAGSAPSWQDRNLPSP